MKNFEFYNPVKIYFGEDEITKLSEILKPYNKIMFTYGLGSIFKNGIYDQVCKQLKGYNFIEFGGIEPNPSYETLVKAVEIGKKEKVDFILAVGGGSVIDGSKFIAAAIEYEGDDSWEILSKQKEIKSAIKLGTVLTLPATGSEMNGNSVISKLDTKEKLAFGSNYVFPVFSILDPTTVKSLPNIQVSNGIVDSYVHVLEQYLTYPVNAMVQDKYSESLMKILIDIGSELLEDRGNYSLNANFMWTACMALNGLIAMGVPTDWSTHMIGHEITALYGVAHAQSLAIVLPGVMHVMREEKSEKIVQYGREVFGINISNESQMIDETIQRTEAFFNSLGIKTKLSDYSIDESVTKIIPERFIKRRFVKLGENKSITPQVVEKILKHRL